MARLDFGVMTDGDLDLASGQEWRTIVEVPDEGPLPDLPPDVLDLFEAESSTAPGRETAASVPAVRISKLSKSSLWTTDSLLILWVAERREWVALYQRHERDFNGWLGFSNEFRGPFRVDTRLARRIAEGFEIDPIRVDPEAIARMPPNELESTKGATAFNAGADVKPCD